MHAIAVGPKGMIFGLDRSGGRINVFRTTSDPARMEHVDTWPGFGLPLDLIVNDDSLWLTDLNPLRFIKVDFKGNRLYTWLVPPDLPDGFLEVHTISVDSNRNLYGGDNQYGRSQKLVPRTFLTELKLRIRDIRQGPDGLIYLLTEEVDGAVLRIEPSE